MPELNLNQHGHVWNEIFAIRGIISNAISFLSVEDLGGIGRLKGYLTLAGSFVARSGANFAAESLIGVFFLTV